VVGAPAKRSDLRTSVDAVDASTRGGVPEVNVTVVRAATSSEEVHVPRAPREGLDSSLVVGLGELRNRQRSGIPDGDEVVVAASSELSAIGAPLKAANLGCMGDELSNLVLGNANIVVVDKTATSTGREKVLVPPHDTDTCIMAEHASNLLALRNVPDLDLASSHTNTDIGAIARPLDAADICIRSGLKETANTTFIGRPDVDIALKTDSDLVTRAPVEEVQVVVVHEARSIKDTLRGSGNAAAELSGAGSRRLEGAVVLLSQVNWLGRLGGSRLELEDASV
jgi:hypothetical protein